MRRCFRDIIAVIFLAAPVALSQERSDLRFSATAVTFPTDRKVELKLRGTTRYPRTNGTATVEYKDGITRLTLNVKELDPPSQRQYTTYVFWAVTPEGLTENIGEFRPRKTSILRIFARSWGGTIETATRHRTFCIVMTAEPHFLVESPSREVVLASAPPDEKEGLETEPVEVSFRGDIGLESVPWREDRLSTERDRETPVELLEARRALDIGRYFRVEEHASAEFKQAEDLLAEAERAFDRGLDEKAAVLARRAIIRVEVARRRARERRESAERRKQESSLADTLERAREAEENLAAARKEIEQLTRTLDQKTDELHQLRARAEDLAASLERAQSRLTQADQTERMLREQLDAVQKRLSEEQNLRQAAEQRQRALEAELDAIRQSSISINEYRAKVALTRVVETRDDGDDFVLVLPNDELFLAGRRPASGVPELNPAFLPKLDYIATVLATFPLGTYTVEGHVSGPGPAERLREISKANAAAVVAYLLSKGVPGDKLIPVGRGAEAPLVKAPTAPASRRNQRVEIVIRRK
ncbi:MAG TPA: OmpA family protein [Blastocatellia bacterium]|nr:OmpA family protein [Blastocatellia bacterium]